MPRVRILEVVPVPTREAGHVFAHCINTAQQEKGPASRACAIGGGKNQTTLAMARATASTFLLFSAATQMRPESTP